MVCNVCGKFIDPKYFFCYDCYKKKNRGEIIKCITCNTWKQRSKIDQYRCPKCIIPRLSKKNEKLPISSDDVYIVKKPKHHTIIKSNVTNRLIKLHQKISYSYDYAKRTKKEKMVEYNNFINNRDKSKQFHNSGWYDGGIY